jgi:anti-anti-sigma factor
MHDRTPPLHVDITRDGVVAKVTVTGELDIATATTLRGHLLDVGATHPDRIVLDLDGMAFVDVAGARALDEMCHLLEAGCPVIVRSPQPSARKVFRLTGLVDDLRFTGLMDD